MRRHTQCEYNSFTGVGVDLWLVFKVNKECSHGLGVRKVCPVRESTQVRGKGLEGG